ncbi:MAG: sulfurtransferase [Acidobacteria bacterium]|nr:sulfurtransferase [Acidobacteriota bacterium]
MRTANGGAILLAGIMVFCASLLNASQAGSSGPRIRSELLVGTEWLQTQLNNPQVIVVHVGRSREGYDSGHIPNARFFSRTAVSVTRDGIPNELPPLEALVASVRQVGIEMTSRVILYDEAEGLDAARVYVALDYLGLGERTALLDGQLKKWKAESRPLSRDAVNISPSSFLPQPRPEVVVPLGAMRDLAWLARQPGSRVVLLDARPEAEYRGEKTGTDIARPGHIPAAVNVFWRQTLESDAKPVLRPVPELQKLYTQAGLQPGDLVVTYCQTGGQASHAYFTAKYLGFEPRLYDGSYMEWSAAKDTAVEKTQP